MPRLSIKECLTFGWNTFKSRPWLFVQAGLIVLLVNIASQVVISVLEVVGEEGIMLALFAGILSLVVSVAVSILVNMGTVSFSLNAERSVTGAGLRDLWHPHPFWKYLFMQILLGLSVMLGLLLLVVPGIILSVVFAFAAYLVIERGLGPIASLKESARLTKGNRWQLFWLSLTLLGINLLGLLALVVGLLITAPVAMLASVHAYRVLSGAAKPEDQVLAGDMETV